MDKHYNYGVIEGNTITLFNDSTITRSLLYSDFLKDVSVEISDTGILYISANKLEYDVYIYAEVEYLKMNGKELQIQS